MMEKGELKKKKESNFLRLSRYKSGDVICQDRKCKENSGFEVKRK